jgi:selenocysteine lyase/cysteine desulfurase
MAGCKGSRAPRSDGAASLIGTDEVGPAATAGVEDWADVRGEFALDEDYVHMGALLVSSHPRRVTHAIHQYRLQIDRNPVVFLQQHNEELQAASRAAAADYLQVDANDVALTDSTTMGLGLLYNGLRLRPGHEVVTTANDYFVTHEALRVACARSGAVLREVRAYEHGEPASEQQLVDRIVSSVGRRTRAVAMTWVHSSTGLKFPVASVAHALSAINRTRDESDRVLVGVDGVHGFGVEDVTMEALGADFFSAGCHKWLFGPRGTGILWGRPGAWAALDPAIPSFTDRETWMAWLEKRTPDGPTTAARVSPGGFKPFEHQWAMRDAFEFHQAIGKTRIAGRTHALARQLKEGIATMPHLRLITPMDDSLSAGIVCFDVEGMLPREAIHRLAEERIIGTVTPYAQMHARLTPSIINSEEDIEAALRALRTLTT